MQGKIDLDRQYYISDVIYSPDSVMVYAPQEILDTITTAYTESVVPVRGVNFPPDKVLRTFPSKVQVTFQVGLSHFKAITAEDFFIGVTYEELLNNKGEKCPVKLKSVPRYVNHVRLNPQEVDYLIEQQIIFND